MKMRAAFIREVLSHLGSPYRWGGKGLPVPAAELREVVWPHPVLDPRLFDASGLVTWAWLKATGQDLRPSHDCDRLLRLCRRVEQPSNGTLVLYGKPRAGTEDATHVTVYVDGCVVGANGGDSTTVSLKVAREQGARVSLRAGPDYRTGRLGYYELPWADEAVRI